MVDRSYRTGTSMIDLPDSLRQGQLGDLIRAELTSELAKTGEWLAQFDFGPPRRSEHRGMRSYDVMYRTGPRTQEDFVPDAPEG